MTELLETIFRIARIECFLRLKHTARRTVKPEWNGIESTCSLSYDRVVVHCLFSTRTLVSELPLWLNEVNRWVLALRYANMYSLNAHTATAVRAD